MIKFIKNLLGFGAKETVKEILTPPVQSDPVVTAITASSSGATYIAPAKPINKKVKALSAPVQTKAKPTQQKPAVTQGKAKGGNNVVKLQPKQSNKPRAPGKPKAKRK